VAETIAAWQEVIAAARQARQQVVIRGGGSKAGLPWQPRCEGALVLVTDQWRGIERFEPSELVVTARSGTPLAEITAALAEAGQWLPFDPPQFAPGGTIGGAVASGLSGPTRLGHGTVRDAILGVRLLDGRGRVLRFGGEVMKNVAGYDVARLMVGAWGTLGVLLTVSLKVAPRPVAEVTCAFSFDAEGAQRQLNRWAGEPLPLSAAFWHDQTLWVALRGSAAGVRAAKARLGGEVVGAAEAARLWAMVRDQQGGPWTLAEGEVLWRLALPPTAPMVPLGHRFWFEGTGGIRWVVANPEWDGFAAATALGGWAWRWRGGAVGPPWQSARSAAVAAIESRLRDVFDPDRLFVGGPFAKG